MGCTRTSAVNLTILILTSYMGNMKATTHSSSTVQDEIEKGPPKIQTISSTKQLSTDFVVTTVDPELKKCQSYFNDTEKENNSVSESSNCTLYEHEATEVSSSEINSSSTITLGKTIVTYRDFSEYNQYKTIGRIAPYLTNVPGFFTNSITIVIAVKIQPVHTSEIYMILLGCADLLTVTARFTFRMVELYLETKSGWVCKIIGYFLTLGQMYSNLILVSWTIERFIAVIFPIKLASWCSIRNTKITAALLLLFDIGFSIPYITDMSAINFWNGRKMVNACHFSEFMLGVWFHIESVYYIYLPMILVCFCNMAILCRLSDMTKSRVSMASNQDTIDKKSKENRKMTILLLTISGTFLVLHIPYAIVMVISYMYPDITILLVEDPHGLAKYLLYTYIGFIVTEFQNSINFFLYCISGSKFRSTFSKLFCRHIAVKIAEAPPGVHDSHLTV